MRTLEDKSQLPGLSIATQNNFSPSENPKIRIAVFGQHGVGKSALTVRYLTRRFIGEYKSNTDLLYNQTVTIGHSSIDVEIVDISTSAEQTVSRRKSFPIEEIQRADAFVIVYSITDRSSFIFAQEALETITNYHSQNSVSCCPNNLMSGSPQPRATCPIMLVGNKNDLEHLRVVEKVDGMSISMQYGCQLYELSVAENSPEVYTCFRNLISMFMAQSKEPSKRKFSVSKMLGNLRIGKNSLSPNHVFATQASVVDTDIFSYTFNSDAPERISPNENFISRGPSPVVCHHRRQSSAPESSSSSNASSSFGSLKSKIAEFNSMKKRHNSPPICSL